MTGKYYGTDMGVPGAPTEALTVTPDIIMTNTESAYGR